MRILLLIGFGVLWGQVVHTQVHYTRTAHVHVKSQNKVKNIEADNYQVISMVNLGTNEVRFEGLLKSFEFKLGALDRVFNSERINVNQYPKFKFEGKIKGLKKIDPSRIGIYEVEVFGTLFLWDEKRDTRATATIETDGKGSFKAVSEFLMRIEEPSMKKLNTLIDQKLPDIVNLTTDSFGVDRDIKIELKANYSLRNW